MIPVGNTIIELLLPGEPNQGYSVMQLITTSNITAHFVDSDSTAYIDVFSCKDFDLEIVKSVVNDYFKPIQIKETFIYRDA
jgi:S-adenosylmethionine/arginine decarboxylase-like enzyme